MLIANVPYIMLYEKLLNDKLSDEKPHYYQRQIQNLAQKPKTKTEPCVKKSQKYYTRIFYFGINLD